MTVACCWLVVHRATARAIRAGRVYLFYTLTAGAVLLLAMVWLSSLAGSAD